jgi:hypothetical protein
MDQGVTANQNIIQHVMDIGANYWSAWNWHNCAPHSELLRKISSVDR